MSDREKTQRDKRTDTPRSVPVPRDRGTKPTLSLVPDARDKRTDKLAVSLSRGTKVGTQLAVSVRGTDNVHLLRKCLCPVPDSSVPGDRGNVCPAKRRDTQPDVCQLSTLSPEPGLDARPRRDETKTGNENEIRFFVPMIPPTATHQTKSVRVVKGKPQFFEPPALQDARAKLTAHLAKHRPTAPCVGPVRCVAKWLFPRRKDRADGQYKDTRPDTDNLQKLLKDVMTDLGFWMDDAQVASEVVEKFWADTPGLFISVVELTDGGIA